MKTGITAMSKNGQLWWIEEMLNRDEDFQRHILRNLVGEALHARNNPPKELHAALKAAQVTPLDRLASVPVLTIVERIAAAVNACPEHCYEDTALEEDGDHSYMVSCGHMCHECRGREPFRLLNGKLTHGFGEGHRGGCHWGRLNKRFRTEYVPGPDTCR